jgi:hypothetical protein
MAKIKRPSQAQAAPREGLVTDKRRSVRIITDEIDLKALSKAIEGQSARHEIHELKDLVAKAIEGQESARRDLDFMRLVIVRIFRRRKSLPPEKSTPREARPPLNQLSSLTDWVPSPVIRKRQRKLLADETAEIIQFRTEGRKYLARWRLAWAWFYWFVYLLSTPFAMVTSAIRKFIV